MGKVILITGGRDFGRPGVDQALSQLLAEHGIDLIIHGDAHDVPDAVRGG